MIDVEFRQICCATCNVLFCVVVKHYDRLVDSKENFYCPAGHANHFTGQNDKQRLEQEIKRAEEYKRLWNEESDLRSKLFKEKQELLKKIRKKKTK